MNLHVIDLGIILLYLVATIFHRLLGIEEGLKKHPVVLPGGKHTALVPPGHIERFRHV